MDKYGVDTWAKKEDKNGVQLFTLFFLTARQLKGKGVLLNIDSFFRPAGHLFLLSFFLF